MRDHPVMYVLYNSLLYLGTILLLPVFILLLLINRRYRDGLFQKLGFISWKDVAGTRCAAPGLGACGFRRRSDGSAAPGAGAQARFPAAADTSFHGHGNRQGYCRAQRAKYRRGLFFIRLTIPGVSGSLFPGCVRSSLSPLKPSCGLISCARLACGASPR